MAINLKFINKMGAKARIAALAGGIVGLIGVVYLIVVLTSETSSTIGASQVTTSSKGLKAVPGGKLSPEYYRAVQQANEQAAKQAEIQGSSAIPTMLNVGAPSTAPAKTADCTIICSDEQVNVSNALDDMVRKGDVSPEISAGLQKLADSNVPVDEYAQELDRLVREGKLTPEQARRLLDQYKKQHANKLLQESAQTMDGMIKVGDLPLDVANELLKAQKDNLSPNDYAAMLDEMVRQGKISKEAARRLLAQYKQQHARQIIEKSVASLKKLGNEGLLTKDVQAALIDLENKMVPISEYKDQLSQFVSAGKLIPATAKKIMDEYLWQKSQMSSAGTINKLLDDAKSEAYSEINGLLRKNNINRETAGGLSDNIRKGLSEKECSEKVGQLEAEGKVRPGDAKALIEDCIRVGGLDYLSKKLPMLQGNNASVSEYTNELRHYVENGILTPEQATSLLDEYKNWLDSISPGSLPTTAEEGDNAFGELQRRLEAQKSQGEAEVATPARFDSAQQAALQGRDEAREKMVSSEQNLMTGYAGKLISAWAPPTMAQEGNVVYDDDKEAAGTTASNATGQTGVGSGSAAGAKLPPLVKAGTVTFAVLDTSANSDYADSPIMATIVDGPLKGAKLLGKLETSEGPSGQKDRVLLNFTTINFDKWERSRAVTAYAIDPDTARTVMASSVDYHYMQRFGAIMATSFLQGYAAAVTNAGTSTTGIFGTSTSNPELSPTQKLAVALGKMGEALGKATEKYTEIPPTVKVNAGVGLGILFMADVEDEDLPPKQAANAASSNAPPTVAPAARATAG